MKKNKHILASFLVVIILLIQLFSFFHAFEHSHENNSDEISLVKKNDVQNISSTNDCLLCDFFLGTEVALLPIFATTIFIALLLSSSEITHILKKKTFSILHRKSRAPPYGV